MTLRQGIDLELRHQLTFSSSSWRNCPFVQIILHRSGQKVNSAPVDVHEERAVEKDNLDKDGREDGQSLRELLVRLRLHIAALERELAAYGTKYGFTETARALLTRAKDS